MYLNFNEMHSTFLELSIIYHNFGTNSPINLK